MSYKLVRAFAFTCVILQVVDGRPIRPEEMNKVQNNGNIINHDYAWSSTALEFINPLQFIPADFLADYNFLEEATVERVKRDIQNASQEAPTTPPMLDNAPAQMNESAREADASNAEQGSEPSGDGSNPILEAVVMFFSVSLPTFAVALMGAIILKFCKDIYDILARRVRMMNREEGAIYFEADKQWRKK